MTVARSRSTDQIQTYVEPAIRALLDRLDPGNRLVGGYQLGYWDADGSPAACQGKGLRPALALLSARATGAEPAAGVPAAAAVELAHNFSLLHDDVMDGDTERRHRPTAWTVFGVGPAILAGDALIGLAHEVLTETPGGCPAARRLAVDIRALVAGQAADLDFERRDDVTLDECLRMAEQKTAALLAGSCALGAILCGGPPGLVDGLSRFGRHLGLAFQLVDDLLGIWGDPRRTGKPVGSDLRTRKRSIPVVRAVTSGQAAARALAELYRSPQPLTDDDVARASALIEATGARDWTAQRAWQETERARAELDALDLPDDVRDEFVDIATFTTGRDH
ncbi:polyprenyl synthetase family protein [Micromonospora sp. DR5-3]|uniref:polyprenyl synthetase family protein n=1 Tax=unclassified Micromonospora TaxID=2617518 RepID=UPI0011D5130D|nr:MULTISPECIES: polyprenyl synthetase family protein [unclassified Micromonospora]MCW3816676.1 polyprenyl synthetase family protein [Micromonospora sp. DR5-3]TYC22541.1 polyprenyl synthetase family protein [Micromonospora sp. MP36]